LNFFDNKSIYLYPTDANLTLMIISRSGTIILTCLNKIFKFSGNSYLPA